MRKKAKYGYIEFIDKRKLKHDGWDDEIEPEIRKPTPLEREEIILNYVRVNSGKSVKVSFFAEQLAVSERTIQTALKNLENKGLIKRTPPPPGKRKHQGYILSFTGKRKTLYPTDLTLKKLYDSDNPCGVRDWHWEDYKFIPGVYTEDFTKEIARYQFQDLQEHKKRTKHYLNQKQKPKK